MCRCRAYWVDALIRHIANAVKHVGLQKRYLSTIDTELNFREVVRRVDLFSKIPLLSGIIVVKDSPDIDSIQTRVEIMCAQ